MEQVETIEFVEQPTDTAPASRDVGPWCLGLPRSGQREMTSAEKERLRRAYRRLLAACAAWVLTLPLLSSLAILILTVLHRPVDTVLIAFFTGALEVIVLLGLPASANNPLARAVATSRDYRAGYVECCEGRYEPNNFKRISSSSATYSDFRNTYALIHRMKSGPEERHRLEILPRSHRVWSFEGEVMSKWVEVGWEGIVRVREVETPDAKNFSSALIGDMGCLLTLSAIFVTIVLYQILDFPLLYAPGILIGLWIAEFNLAALYVRWTMRK